MDIRQLNHLLLFVCGIFSIHLGVMGSSVEEHFKTAVHAGMQLLGTPDIATCHDHCLSRFTSLFEFLLRDKHVAVHQRRAICKDHCEEIHNSRGRVHEGTGKKHRIPQYHRDPAQGIPAYQHNCEINCLGGFRSAGGRMNSHLSTCKDRCEKEAQLYARTV